MAMNPKSGSRRGTALYIAVMGVGLMVGVMALTTASINRIQMNATRERTEQLAARAAAQSGLEHALNWINRNPDWRTRLSSGVNESNTFLSNETGFRWRVTDADNLLADDLLDHAVLRSVGFVSTRDDDTSYAYEVDIEPAGRGLTSLNSAVHADARLDVGATSVLSGSGVASSNNEVNGQGNQADIQLEVEATVRTLGGAYNGGSFEGSVLRELPGGHVFDWYVERGTPIAFSALDAVPASSDRRLSERVLSRELNPFGAPNPLGIYVIDCGGLNLRILRCRVLGTLVVLNAGANTQIESTCFLSAAPSNYPALLVQGDLEIDLSAPVVGQSLVEIAVNFNPPGAPDNGGLVDADSEDTHPARIDGVVYATGTICVADDTLVHGAVIADRVEVKAGRTLEVQHRSFASNFPPPGFTAGLGARVLPGTLRRVSVD